MRRDLIDVLSMSGLRTGEVLPRSEIHRLGKPHRAVHLYLFNSHDELLVQRRALTVDNYPGALSISVLGHVDAGEFSSQTVRRELEEELGLDTSHMRFDFVFSHFREARLSDTYIDRQFNDVYVAHADFELALLHPDRTEVSDVMFVPWQEFEAMAFDDASELAPVYAAECRELVTFLAHRAVDG